MKKELSIKELENLIENRMSMQSTQRELQGYGVNLFSLNYLKSKNFAKTYVDLAPFQKRSILKTLAGINWHRAGQLIDLYHNLEVK